MKEERVEKVEVHFGLGMYKSFRQKPLPWTSFPSSPQVDVDPGWVGEEVGKKAGEGERGGASQQQVEIITIIIIIIVISIIIITNPPTFYSRDLRKCKKGGLQRWRKPEGVDYWCFETPLFPAVAATSMMEAAHRFSLKQITGI